RPRRRFGEHLRRRSYPCPDPSATHAKLCTLMTTFSLMVSPVSLPAESIVTRIQSWCRQRRPPNGPRLPQTRCRQTPTPQGFAESPSARVRARLQPARNQDELCTLVTTFSPCSVTCVIVRRIECHQSTKSRPAAATAARRASAKTWVSPNAHCTRVCGATSVHGRNPAPTRPRRETNF